MPNSPQTQYWDFSIGGVALYKQEVPEEFDLGHEVEFKEHRYIDESGRPLKKVHVQGAFHVPTGWKGVFTTNSAIDRALQLDQLTLSRQPVLFQYGPLQYVCQIRKFKFSPHWQTEVHYEIELTIIEDKNGQTNSQPNTLFDVTSQSYFDSSQTAFANLQSSAGVSLPSTLTTAQASATTAITSAYPLGAQTFSTLTSVIASLDAYIAQLSAYATPLESTAILEKDLQNLALCLQALGAVALLRGNIQQLLGSQAGAKTILASGDLFDVATQYYPNVDVVTAATAIATANNLLDFFISPSTPLTLPAIFN